MTRAVLGWVDGRAARELPLDDRGLGYGDGVFETLLIADQTPLWWEAHLQRMARGAAVLGIVAPDVASWERDLRGLLQAAPAELRQRSVLRLTLTRGSGGRGYAISAPCRPRRMLSLSPAPDVAAAAERGLRLRWCTLQLALQPMLAGIKHLNRLEQVLARKEWCDPAIDEGVLCSADGAVVSAVAGNLVWRDAQGWHTPPVDRCGIAGTCREWGLRQRLWDQRECSRAQLQECEALLVCNSVRGILPVAALGERELPADGSVRTLQQALGRQLPAFAHAFLTPDL